MANAFISNSLEKRTDIAYGPDPLQTLDIYAASKPRGVLIFVHGGTWDSGDKTDYPFLADTFVENGYTTLIVNYRLVPEITFPVYAEDVALAVAWALEQRELLGSENVFVLGHSAGAHIGALVAFDESYLAAVGHTTAELSGFLGLAGPYDFLPPDPDALRTRAALGPEEHWPATQPINFIGGDEPPVFLATGLDDTTVDPGNSLRLAEKIRSSGGEAVLYRYPEVDHVGIVGALARVGRALEPQLLPDILEFLNRFS